MQGFNMGRYYPPDTDNPPRFNTTTHPLGSRASKLSQGLLTVRFELPFAVWCTTCKPEAIVGQGVRFNAQKRRIGSYHSTPIWAFRMKHTPCGGWWEIRTDPKNAEYVVHEGARRRDYGKAVEGEGEMKFLSEGERERRREDAFARLEGRKEESGVLKVGRERVEELLDVQEQWRDPYTANQKLRRRFRVRRKELEKEEEVKEGLKEKYGLELEIVTEREEDRFKAGLVEFGPTEGTDGEVLRRGLFEGKEKDSAQVHVKGKLKTEIKAEKSRQGLQETLVGNTKAAMDPFLSKKARTKMKPAVRILKRKRADEEYTADRSATISAPQRTTRSGEEQRATSLPLVEYDSD
ncbi:DUF572-domain-containing protein [Sporormia fimetaria CBS 119925]|uniref:DUF572-domain-containing protein n=1 Tax=Sporormia fimetaria CBS 119925 TaxID=1340428 RepID=A0A6A6UYH7_9PLEO|nr:DUF572-domain-containing protein [Sporormia fimetaria CBS 119925]